MKAKYLLLGLGLLMGCGKSSEQHAREVALERLKSTILPPSRFLPESLQVRPFPADSINYFITDAKGRPSGYLAIYSCDVATPTGIHRKRLAALITAQDSVFSFFPFRHADEFRLRYKTSY